MSDTEQMIPKTRFDQRVQQARDTEAALREQLAQLTEQNKTLTRQAGKAENLAQQVAKLTADLETAGQAHGRQMAATRAGITDPEDVADVLAIFERRAPEGVSLADWLGGDNLPRSVRSMLPQPAQTQAQPQAQPAPPQAPPHAQPEQGQNGHQRALPRSNRGVIQGQATGTRQGVSDIHRAMLSDPGAAAQQRVRLGLPEKNPHAYRLHLGRRRG